jgi:hypothetical protein
MVFERAMAFLHAGVRREGHSRPGRMGRGLDVAGQIGELFDLGGKDGGFDGHLFAGCGVMEVSIVVVYTPRLNGRLRFAAYISINVQDVFTAAAPVAWTTLC